MEASLLGDPGSEQTTDNAALEAVNEWLKPRRGVGFEDGVAGQGGSSSARPCRSWNVRDGMGQAAVIVATQTVRSIAQTQRPIQMLMHRHRAAGQGSCASARVRSASEDSQSSRCCRDSPYAATADRRCRPDRLSGKAQRHFPLALALPENGD
jgi:hypothetical protein